MASASSDPAVPKIGAVACTVEGRNAGVRDIVVLLLNARPTVAWLDGSTGETYNINADVVPHAVLDLHGNLVHQTPCQHDQHGLHPREACPFWTANTGSLGQALLPKSANFGAFSIRASHRSLAPRVS